MGEDLAQRTIHEHLVQHPCLSLHSIYGIKDDLLSRFFSQILLNPQSQVANVNFLEWQVSIRKITSLFADVLINLYVGPVCGGFEQGDDIITCI